MKRFFIGLIKTYKNYLSPLLVSVFGKGCRFTPTCSEYTIEALERFGTIKGLWIGLLRFLRCHPLGGSGYDPVPEIHK